MCPDSAVASNPAPYRSRDHGWWVHLDQQIQYEDNGYVCETSWIRTMMLATIMYLIKNELVRVFSQAHLLSEYLIAGNVAFARISAEYRNPGVVLDGANKIEAPSLKAQNFNVRSAACLSLVASITHGRRATGQVVVASYKSNM